MWNILLCLPLALGLTFIATLPASADTPDKVRFLVAKAGDDTARVTIGSHEYLVPITFETIAGLGWKDVKDGYELPPAYIAMLKQGRITISITCSGTQFAVVPAHRK